MRRPRLGDVRGRGHDVQAWCIAAADVYDDCIESGAISPLVCVHVENGLEYPVAEGCVNAFFDVLACQTNCTDRYGNPCD